MLTYVINTSETKAFNSDLLFDLADYSKIRWMHATLDHVQDCAEEIAERQKILGADKFRISVIVDFYSFDRVRRPHGMGDDLFGEAGVDLCLYYPYIEAYLGDHLFDYLKKQSLYPAYSEIFYIQNENQERYEQIKNEMTQLGRVLTPCGEPEELRAQKETVQKIEKLLRKKQEELAETESTASQGEDGKEKAEGKTSKKKKPAEEENGDAPVSSEEELKQMLLFLQKEDLTVQELEDVKVKLQKRKETVTVADGSRNSYSEFDLYCSANVSLHFDVREYPYSDGTPMTFEHFYRELHARMTERHRIRVHTYITDFGGGEAYAAFEAFSLSLYLIRMYEREDRNIPEGNIEVDHLDALALKNALEYSWVKIRAAQKIVTESDCQYYKIESQLRKTEGGKAHSNVAREKTEIRAENERSNFEDAKTEDLFRMISGFAERDTDVICEKDREEFDNIIRNYFKERDKTTEKENRAEYDKFVQEADAKEKTDQFPSRMQYELEVEKTEKEISDLYQHALTAGYNHMEYDKEYETASELYAEHRELKARAGGACVWDIVFLVLSLLAMILPYHFLQGVMMATPLSIALYLLAAAVFGGLFVICFCFVVVPVKRQLRAIRKRMVSIYRNCLLKQEKALAALRCRYGHDLNLIERYRYEIRQMKYLYERNCKKNERIRNHLEMLENVENQISTILSNLGVVPEEDYERWPDTEDIEFAVRSEMDLEKPIRNHANKIYHIFSIEAIEKMFPKKQESNGEPDTGKGA